jgi:Protein of unknown function (DUF2851)
MDTRHIPEAVLHFLWQQLLFPAAGLRTTDGKRVSVLYPGRPNTDGGPDFRDARIRIGGITYRGDVEIHNTADEWEGHHHASNPRYNSVILHVVMTDRGGDPVTHTSGRRPVPVVILSRFLGHSPHLSGLSAHIAVRPIPCHDRNDHMPGSLIRHWLSGLARERLEMKVLRFHERLKELADECNGRISEPFPRYTGNPEEIPPSGKEYSKKDFADRGLWEQLLYEGILESLGFAQNADAFLRLAQSIRLSRVREYAGDDLHLRTSMLFGAAGLLPSPRGLPEKDARKYVRTLRTMWRRLKPLLNTPILHEGEWQFFRLRPSNFPTARLAAFCHVFPVLFGDGAFREFIRIFQDHRPAIDLRLKRLEAVFRFTPEDFWRTHYHFHGSAGKWGIAIGRQRIHNIIINVMIPIALLYSRVFVVPVVGINARRLMAHIPGREDNRLIRIVGKQLVKDRFPLDSASLRQGAIQLYSLFCMAARCSECAVGQHLDIGNR